MPVMPKFRWKHLANALLAYFLSLLLVTGLDIAGIYLPLAFGIFSPLLLPLLLLIFTLILSSALFKFTKADSLSLALLVLFVLFCLEALSLHIGAAVNFQFSPFYFAGRLVVIAMQSAVFYLALRLLLPRHEPEEMRKDEAKSKKVKGKK